MSIAIKEEKLREVKSIAWSKHGRCLSKEYINRYTPLKWQCHKGHTWDMAPSYIYQGAWCSACDKINKYLKLKKEERLTYFRELAEEKGGICSARKYNNRYDQVDWKCHQGHTWKVSFDHISAGYWCPECKTEELNKKRLLRIEKIISKKGGKCLTTKLSFPSRSKVKVICKKGHRFEIRVKNLYLGMWCSECARDNFRVNLDEVRKFAISRGGKLISGNYRNNKENLLWECKKGHQWRASLKNVHSNKSWCPECNGNPAYSISDMRKLARLRNGECLSSAYKSVFTPLKWRCEMGHIWEARPNNIRNGSWCPVCGLEKISQKLRSTITEMQKLAGKRGGKCISKQYINNTTPLEWECSKGHRWKTRPQNVASGTWCPVCGIEKMIFKRRQRKKISVNK